MSGWGWQLPLPLRRLLVYLIGLVALLAAWELTSFLIRLTAPGYLANVFPSLAAILSSMWESRAQLGLDFLASLNRVVISLALAMAIATPLGLIIGHERTASKILSPIIYITYPIPKIVFLPFLFILLGIGNASKITLITLVVFFQILLSTRDAAQNVPKDYIVSVLSTGASKLGVYRHVIIPASLPAVLTSARISIGIAIAALYLAETFFTRTDGLGAFIERALELHYFPDVYAGIVAMGFLGFLLYLLLDLLERVLCRWKYL